MNVIRKITQLGLLIGLGLQIGHTMENRFSEQQEANQRMDLIVEAFQGIGFNPTYVFTKNNEIDVFTGIPENFIKFVKTDADVPLSENIGYFGRYFPQYHCDFSRDYNWDNKWSNEDGYLYELIELEYGGGNSPDIMLRLWANKGTGKRQIFVTPDSAVFHIDIMRIDSERKDLKIGLKNFVSKNMKNGFYVIAPDSIEQVDWRKNNEIVNHFKTKMRHKYMKTINDK